MQSLRMFKKKSNRTPETDFKSIHMRDKKTLFDNTILLMLQTKDNYIFF